jgi:hypothetical protein
MMAPDEALDRLRRAGWSVGDAVAGGTWIVTGSHGGENLIHATGATQAETWQRAVRRVV